MKNDHLPLIQALKNKGAKGTPANVPEIQAPRTIMVHHSEIPGLPGRQVGEPVTVNIQGHVHSQHNDGHAIIHVNSVKPDTSDMEKKSNPDAKVPERGVGGELRVRTQQSHAG